MSDYFILKTSLRDLIRAKRVMASLMLIVAPAAIALLWRYAARDMFDPYDAYNTLSSVVVYGFLLVILAVVFGTGVVSQEIEQKTIVYLLTRPVPRWRIMLMKFLAAVVGITVTVIAATLLLGAVTVWAGGEASSVIRQRDLRSPSFLVAKLTQHDDPVAEYLYDKLPDWTKDELKEREKQIEAQREGRQVERQRQPVRRTPGGPGRVTRVMRHRPEGTYYQRMVLRQVNRTLLTDSGFYSEERFPEPYLTPKIRELLNEKPKSGQRLARLNRLLMESHYSEGIKPRMDPVFPIRKDLLILPVGALAYGALFLLLATLLNRPLMYGLVFAFGWESWVPNLPGKFQTVSIMSHLRTLAPHPRPAAETVDLLQFLSGGNQVVITQGLARGVLIGVIFGALLMALVVFSNNEYVPREDAE